MAHLAPHLVPRYAMYLSFTGGPTLLRIEDELGSPRAFPLYCAVDPTHYGPEVRVPRWDLGYMGTYSDDRQLALQQLLIEPARRAPDRRFIVVGPEYPDAIDWGADIERRRSPPRVLQPAGVCAQRDPSSDARGFCNAAAASDHEHDQRAAAGLQYVEIVAVTEQRVDQRSRARHR